MANTFKKVVKAADASVAQPTQAPGDRAPGGDDRLKRSAEESRLSASGDRTAHDEREADDTEHFAAPDDDWSFERMPGLPTIPGFQTIWLSTTHKQDTIARRLKLGYTLIRSEECPDLSTFALKDGDYAGHVMCEEMIAAKLPDALWRKYMTHFHHQKPLDDETGIKEEIERVQQRAKDVKGRVDLEGGMAELGQVRRPRFGPGRGT